MGKIEDNIKRMAQLLFDNAKTISQELTKSENYRALSLQFDVFKHQVVELKTTLYIYDSTSCHYFLYDKYISPEGLEGHFCRMNIDTGISPLPKPTKLRDKL